MAGMVISKTLFQFALVLWAAALIWVVGSILVFATLDSILRAALYVYATEGRVPENFDNDLITGAFKSSN